ncbi:hypothetical protein [Streptomyces muensis]|uniref:Uncharacterized protein n=1 Tax=Streptomyces muensis TaxID=1077944 RepID=A0A9X1PXR1_STRM4|nr:hypothetical protein [Streptomyces muensis]MCF1595457.1 hypothetical protein [Streptomyces muensis]
MTEAERAFAIESVGQMAWGGVMAINAAVWFVAGLLQVDYPEAERLVASAMTKAMAKEVDRNLVKIGNANGN